MCKELDRDISTFHFIKKIVINPELCDGRSDKGKIRKKAPELHRAMTRIKRELCRNPLGCSKDVFEYPDFPVQINSTPYPEARGSPSINGYPQERGWSGQKITGKFSNCFVHQ